MILATSMHQIPDTLDAVPLVATSATATSTSRASCPTSPARGSLPIVDAFLAANHLGRKRIDHWMLHPGGRRIVERYARPRAAGRRRGDELEALADHGNVGTPSIFYVLNSTIEERHPARGELGLAVTIGPGVTVGLMLRSAASRRRPA